MNSKQVKEFASKSGVKLWEVAEELHITPAWLSCKLHHVETDSELEIKIVDAICKVSARHESEGC